MPRRTSAAALACLVLAATALADDWPQWRGARRDGRAAATQLPAKWPKQAPRPLWRVALGEGYSSPVIADGRLYILSRQAGDTEVCWCLDAGSGKTLWKQAYAAPYKPADPSAGQGPKSTPTIDGGRVYMFGVSGMFHCFDSRTGRILWKHDCPREYWGVEKDKDGDDAWSPCCGAAASPLIDGDRVILPVGGKKAGAMTAFDKKQGKIVWKSLEDRGSYASPVVAELAGLRQVIGFTGRRMVGLDARDGRLLWEYPFPAAFEQTVVTPVVWKDLVLIGGERKPTVALKVQIQDGKATTRVAWRNQDLRSYLASPVVFKDHLVGLNDVRGQLVCLDLATGRTTWAEGEFGRYVSLIVASEQLLALNGDGELTVLRANPKDYTPIAQWQVSEAGKTWSHLAVVGSRLYVKDKEHLQCFELAGP